jgi:hypothetical protein
VLPVARSQFEKMVMRGEKVNLDTIRQNVTANMGDIKTRVKDFGSEVSQSASQFMNTRGRDFGREVSSAVRNTASRGGSVLGTILKSFLLFIGIMISFALFMALIGYSFGGFADLANGFILRTTQMRVLGWFTVILLLGVPLISLVTFMVRRALRIRSNRYLNMAFLVLWIAGFICAGFLAPQIASGFRTGEQVSNEVPVAQPLSGRMILTVPSRPIEYSNSIAWLQGDIRGWDVSGDTMRSAEVAVVPRLSPDSLYHVFVTRYSRGRNASDAAANANMISYEVRNVFGSDSLVALDNGFMLTKAQGFHGQDVTVEVQVPAGKKIRFDESLEDKLTGGHSIRHRSRHSYAYNNWEINIDEDYEGVDWQPNVDYIMASNGSLVNALHPTDTVDSWTNSVHHRYHMGGYSYQRKLQRAERERHEEREQRNRERNMSRQTDSLDRALEAIERDRQRKMDSLDRAMDAIQRQKERMD